MRGLMLLVVSGTQVPSPLTSVTNGTRFQEEMATLGFGLTLITKVCFFPGVILIGWSFVRYVIQIPKKMLLSFQITNMPFAEHWSYFDKFITIKVNTLVPMS